MIQIHLIQGIQEVQEHGFCDCQLSSTKTVSENQTTVHTFTADETVTWSLNGSTGAAVVLQMPSENSLY